MPEKNSPESSESEALEIFRLGFKYTRDLLGLRAVTSKE